MCETTWINRKRPMPTIYILRLNYVCIYTGPGTTTPLQIQWRIKSVEKDTYLKKYQTLLVVATDDINGSDDEDIVVKIKSCRKPFHPCFT
jgi:hypothetical protein